MSDSAGLAVIPAGFHHVVEEARDVGRVGEADGKALFGSVHHLEQGGCGAVLLEVADLAVVQMQIDAAAAGRDLIHKAFFIEILNVKHTKIPPCVF